MPASEPDFDPGLVAPSLSRWVRRQLSAHPELGMEVARLAALPIGRDQLDELYLRLAPVGIEDEAALRARLRRLRNVTFAALCERDLSGEASLLEVCAAMSDLAELAIQEGLIFAGKKLAERHGVPRGVSNGAPQDLLVVGMGKLGGRELNVSSDIDLIFVYGEDGATRAEGRHESISNFEFFTRLGRRLIGILSELTAEGFVFRVDMRLRPNGDSGPLVASLAMLEEYFVVQGRNWERFAWIKARVVSTPLWAGAELAAELDELVRPFVYRRYLDFGAIEALRGLHDEIRAENLRRSVRHAGRENNVKLGRGGIREIEFIVQHFQLIRGGREPSLRGRSTLQMLEVLAAADLLEPALAHRLARIYTLLRGVEHRLQYLDDAQTHVLPTDPVDQEIIAEMCSTIVPEQGFAALAARLASEQAFVAEQFDDVFRSGAKAESTVGSSITHLWSEDVCANAADQTLLDEISAAGFANALAVHARLRALWTSARIRSLPSGMRERLDRLMPRVIEFAKSAASSVTSAEMLLARLLDLVEAIAGRGSYLALLNEYPQALRHLAEILAASPWGARYLTMHPLLLDELLDERTHVLPDWDEVRLELYEQLRVGSGDTERQMDILREIQHAYTFRLLIQDLEGRLGLENLSDQLSALADLILEAALRSVWAILREDADGGAQPPRFAIIAYGKLGGKELGYASDLDLIFLYDQDAGEPDEAALYARLAQRLMSWLSTATTAGRLFEVDLRLRPDGASGLLVTSMAAYRQYQEKSAWVWEHQALTRARFCAGDPAVGAAFEAEREKILRMPRDIETLQDEVSKMREKMHAGHPNRSGEFDLKHDRGGMVDIEFCVQFLVLGYSSKHPSLLFNLGNIALLARAASAGLITHESAEEVANAYRRYRKRQHQLRLSEAPYARVAQGEYRHERQMVEALWTVLGLAKSGPPSPS